MLENRSNDRAQEAIEEMLEPPDIEPIFMSTNPGQTGERVLQ